MNLVKTIVPYAGRFPIEQLGLLREQGIDPIYLEMDNADGYWSLLKSLWNQGDTIIVVEHDIWPWPGATQEIAECSKPWCAFAYHRYFDQEHPRSLHDYFGFGCVKFGTELMLRTARIWRECADTHWSKLDSHFERATSELGIRPHHHRPPVLHLKIA